MAMKFSSGGGGDFQPIPAGTYMAVCTQIVDLGLQPGSAQYPSPKHKIMVRFEIPSERIQIDGKDLPAIISTRYTASMNEKAILRKHLESWRGRKFTDQEAEDFDVEKLLGVSVMLSVVHSEKGGKTYADIAALSAVPKNMPPVKAEGDVFIHNDEHNNYDKLTDFVKKLIDGQIKAGDTADKVYQGAPAPAPVPAAVAEANPFDDDVPF